MSYFDSIEQDLRDAHSRDVQHRRRRNRRRRIAGGTTLLAVAVALTALVSMPRDRTATAAAWLSTASAKAAEATNRPARIRVEMGGLIRFGNGPRSWTLLSRGETYTQTLTADGRLRNVDSSQGTRTPAGPRDRARWIAAGMPEIPDIPVVLGQPVQIGEQGRADPNKLPTDPDALLKRLRHRVASNEHPREALFIIAGELLFDPVVRPPMRAALFDALTRVEGIVVDEHATDRLGRPGAAISLTSRYSEETGSWRTGDSTTKTTLLFDRETTRALSREVTLLSRLRGIDVPPGTLIAYRTYTYS